jgi:hypothetical protein
MKNTYDKLALVLTTLVLLMALALGPVIPSVTCRIVELQVGLVEMLVGPQGLLAGPAGGGGSNPV